MKRRGLSIKTLSFSKSSDEGIYVLWKSVKRAHEANLKGGRVPDIKVELLL